MTVTVNGKPRPLGEAQSLADLLKALGVRAEKMAVERNGVIIPAHAFGNTPVAPGDQIEIIQFVGGG
ncbi:MAG: sulfur carrier protein ThiS [Kiritimatiellia bacterium]|jgi:thiamine biosynthesis protein ThiS|nr:sulfur carrier protein ThiS [Kiritimatiellia bacterium]